MRRSADSATRAVRDCPLPTIAAISGYAMGGGCGLALACDFRIGDASTQMGIPAARLGIVYGPLDCSLLLRQVGLANAKRVLYSGRAFGLAECRRMGLVDMVAEQGSALAAAHAFAADLSNNAPSVDHAAPSWCWTRWRRAPPMPAPGRSEPSSDRAMDSADYREGAAAFAASGRRVSRASIANTLKAGEPGDELVGRRCRGDFHRPRLPRPRRADAAGAEDPLDAERPVGGHPGRHRAACRSSREVWSASCTAPPSPPTRRSKGTGRAWPCSRPTATATCSWSAAAIAWPCTISRRRPIGRWCRGRAATRCANGCASTAPCLTPLDEEARGGDRTPAGRGRIEAVAICFLHSYANPEHERRAAEILSPPPARRRHHDLVRGTCRNIASTSASRPPRSTPTWRRACAGI